MSTAPAAPLWIKICGLRNVVAIEAAVDARVQAVGFVFHESSPRNLALAEAAQLQAVVPAEIERIAVFLHPSQELFDAVLAQVRPDCVQMDAADLRTLRLPAGQATLPVLRSGACRSGGGELASRCLFEGARSGAGEKAEWAEAAQLARTAQVVLAGGLSVANIAEAIGQVRPYGIDVSSGVESSRGEKSPALIKEFVQAARAAHARLTQLIGGRAAEEIDHANRSPED